MATCQRDDGNTSTVSMGQVTEVGMGIVLAYCMYVL